MTDGGAAADGAERRSLVRRMLGVFFSPGDAFAALGQHSACWDWIVPTVLVAAAGLTGFWLTLPYIEAENRAQVLARLSHLSPAEQEKAVAMAVQASRIFGPVFVPVSALLMVLGAGAVLLAIGRLYLGAPVAYTQTLAVWAHASLVNVLGFVVRVPLMRARETIKVFLGPAVLLPDAMLDTFVGRVLAGADVFMVWQVCLAGYGLGVIAGGRVGKAMGTVLVLWALVVVAMAGLLPHGPAASAGG